MWEIWANQLLPKALKTCPKSNYIAQSGHTAVDDVVVGGISVLL